MFALGDAGGAAVAGCAGAAGVCARATAGTPHVNTATIILARRVLINSSARSLDQISYLPAVPGRAPCSLRNATTLSNVKARAASRAVRPSVLRALRSTP